MAREMTAKPAPARDNDGKMIVAVTAGVILDCERDETLKPVIRGIMERYHEDNNGDTVTVSHDNETYAVMMCRDATALALRMSESQHYAV